MPAPPAELVSQIVELKDEFQRVAENHPWISLYVPPIEKEQEVLFLGEQAASPCSSNETTFRDPVAGHNVTVPIAWGVDSPKGIGRQAVVDHVQQLTDRAERLLKRVLDYDSQIPPDAQQEIREWEQRRMSYGWVRWLFYATVVRSVSRFENYPQKAATALWELKEICCAAGPNEAFLFEGRLRFDETTHTIHLDRRAFHIDEPKAFALYKLLADQKGMPITRREIRSKDRHFRGDKTVRQLLDKLPRNLRRTVKSNNTGYWIDLPQQNLTNPRSTHT